MPIDSLRTYLGFALVMAMVLVIGCSPAAQAPAGTGGAGGTTTGGDQVNTKAPFPTQGEPKQGGVLRTAQTDDPPSFDLHQESTSSMQNITWGAYNNLVIFDPYDPTKIHPDAAERWEVSKDGKEVVFRLHKGIKFTNGNLLTSADVKFSLERMKDPPKGIRSPRKDALDPIERIETPDEYTVKLVLSRPYAALMPTLAQGWTVIYDKEFMDARGQDVMVKEVMGSGAFKLKEYVRGISVTMVKNESYWQQGVPYLDGHIRYMIPDKGTRFAAFKTGNLDSYGPDVLEAEDLEKSMSDKISIQRGTGISWDVLNMNATRKPFNDIRVRQAVNLAMDRQAQIKLIESGAARVGGYVPPSSPYALPESELLKLPGYGPDKEADRAKAKQLMAEAGYPNGFEVVLQNRKQSQDLGVFTVDQLAKVGIKATMKILDSGPAYDAATNREFDMLPWGHGLALDDPDAIYSELYLCESTRNYSGVCDPKVNELFEKQSRELDPEKRKAAVWELEKYAIPQVIKIVYSWSDSRLAQWNYVKGYMRHPGSYNTTHWKQVWLDK